MKFSTTGVAACGATTISVDGVEPTNLIGITAGNPKWLDAGTLVFQYEVSPAVFGLGTLDPPSGAIVNIDSIGQNALAAGNNVWNAYLASGASVGVRTNVSGFGRFPLAAIGDVDENGLSVLITSQSAGFGLQCYTALGVQTAATSVALASSNVRARTGLVAYQDSAGWHLDTIAALASQTLLQRTATITLMIPVVVSGRQYVVEFASAVGMTIRQAAKSQGYIIPATTSNLFNPDAVFVTGTTVRIGGCSASGEAPTELRTFDIDVASGAFRTGVTTSGTLVWTTQSALTPTTFQTSGSTGGSAATDILAGLYQEPVTSPTTSPQWRMTQPWYQGLLKAFKSLLPINLSSSQVTGVLPASHGGTGSTTGLTNLLPAWVRFSAASRLLGRGSLNGAGTGEEISLGAGLSMAGTILSATGGSSVPVVVTVPYFDGDDPESGLGVPGSRGSDGATGLQGPTGNIGPPGICLCDEGVVGVGIPGPAGPAGSGTGTVTNTGTLTANRIIKGNGGVDITVGDLTGDVTTSGTMATTAKAALKDTGLGITIDGGGSAITTGIKGDLYIPFTCTITAVTMLADQSGSIVVDVWKDTYANYPPTVADTITASALPTITTAVKSQDTTLTGWTTSITAGDTLRFNVNSITTVTRLLLTLTVSR